jgi:hypothetical protein
MTTDASRGERALMCAVLEDAVECLLGRNGRRVPDLATDAQAWFEDRNREWPFSFENICAALELDSNRIGTHVLARARNPQVAAPARSVAYRCPPAPPARERIQQLIHAGHPLRVVAAEVGLSIAQVSALSERLPTRVREERNAEIRRFGREGVPLETLATRFRLSRRAVAQICAYAGTAPDCDAVTTPALAASP